MSQSQIVFMAFKNSVITLKNVRVWCGVLGADPEGGARPLGGSE